MLDERGSGDEPSGSCTVALVDDESLIRSSLARILTDGGMRIVGEAANGDDAIELVKKHRPDVVVMDIMLPGTGGLEVIEQLGRCAPASHVLVLTRAEPNRVVDAIIAGASGYVVKSAAPQAIISAVSATAAGDCVLPSVIAGKLLERIREAHVSVSDSIADAIRTILTARELEVFTLLASGRSNQQIGRDLSLSAHTVANHIKSILGKLHLDNRIQAAAQAVRSGIA